MTVGQFFSNQWQTIIAAAITLAMATAALVWSKHPVRWLLAVATVVLAVVVVRYPLPALDPRLPDQFLGAVKFKAWVFVFGVVAMFAVTHLVGLKVGPAFARWRAAVGFSGASEPGGGARFAAVEDAWYEFLRQLARERIRAAEKPLFLILAPDEAMAESVLRASGVRFLVEAPGAPDAPLHGYAAGDALYLPCVGASATGGLDGSAAGEPDGEGVARLEALCRLVAAVSPERPTLRGVVVLIPYRWPAGGRFFREAKAIYDDLVAVRRALGVVCPTVTVFQLTEEPESLPGVSEYVAGIRSVPALAGQLPEVEKRCGFAVPTTLAPGEEVFGRGLAWAVDYFWHWSLFLMADAVEDAEGNARILAMNRKFRKVRRDPTTGRKNLQDFLTDALPVEAQADHVLYRGCYFLAGGPAARDSIYAPGLLNGTKGAKLLADRGLTVWSGEAARVDRRYRRLAGVLALATAAVAGPVWYHSIIGRLEDLGSASVGWAGVGTLLAAWSVGLGPPLWRLVYAWYKARPARAAARPAVPSKP